MDLNEIQSLIKFVSKSGVSEVELETKDIKITIKATQDTDSKKGVETQVVNPAMAMGAPMPNMQQMQSPMPMGAPQQQPQAQPQQAPQEPEAQKEEKQEEKAEDKNTITVKSPMIGTFYRSPSPDKAPFVNVGDTIKKGDVLCIIEAMKLFNEIESEVSGKIVKVHVEDSSPIEYDQPLFEVESA